MYYVQLDMKMPDGSLTKMGTSSTRDLDKAVSQLTSYREVAEMLVSTEIIKAYELRLGTIPNALL